MIVVLMGVSGSGKTTLGKKLAEKLGWFFLEGDDFHSGENKVKMESGVPLTDADRLPWLEAIAVEIKQRSLKKDDLVVACSALKEKYRKILSGEIPVRWVYLKGNREMIRRRMMERQGHFMKPELLDSQFSVLEEPAGAIVVDISSDSDKIVRELMDQLKGG